MANNINALVTADYTNAISSDGIEIIIDNRTGESFVTARGYARMSGASESNVRKRLGTAHFLEVKQAQIQTAQGLRTAHLIPGKIAREWLAKDKPELLAAMAEAGWNVYLHTLAGYKVESKPRELTRMELLTQGYAIAMEELEKAKETIDELVEENVILTPKAKAFDRFLNDDGLMTMEDFAKTANVPGIGTNKMFELLREYEFIQHKPSVLPYQRHIASGLFVVKQVPARGNSYVNGSRYFKQTFITRKGVEHLISKLGIN